MSARVVVARMPDEWNIARHLYDVTDPMSDGLRAMCGQARFNVGPQEPFDRDGCLESVCLGCLTAYDALDGTP